MEQDAAALRGRAVHLESMVKVSSRTVRWSGSSSQMSINNVPSTFSPPSCVFLTPPPPPSLHSPLPRVQVKDREIERFFKVLESAKETEFETASQKLQASGRI